MKVSMAALRTAVPSDRAVSGRKPDRNGARVLDVGCALGDCVAAAQGAGWQAEGVELAA